MSAELTRNILSLTYRVLSFAIANVGFSFFSNCTFYDTKLGSESSDATNVTYLGLL